MVSFGAGLPPVLLVGDAAAQFEPDFATHGLQAHVAGDANDAVARLKATRFAWVVVPQTLRDMSGLEFTHGVLRHFEAAVLFWGSGLDPKDAAAWMRSGRFVHFPPHVDGNSVADFLRRKLTGQPLAGGASPVPPPFGAPIGTPLGAQGAFAPFAVNGSLPPGPMPPPRTATPQWKQSPEQRPEQRIEPRADARADSVERRLAELEAQLQHTLQRAHSLEGENTALKSEVDAARHAALAQVAQVMALSDEGDAVEVDLDAMKADADLAEREKQIAVDELAAIHAENEGLRAQLKAAQGEVARKDLDHDGIRADLERHKQQLQTLERERARLAAELANAHAGGGAEELVRELNDIHDQTLAELDEARAKADAAAHDAELARAEMGELLRALQAAQQERAESQRELAEVRHQHDELSREAFSLKIALDDVQRRLESVPDEATVHAEQRAVAVELDAARTALGVAQQELQALKLAQHERHQGDEHQQHALGAQLEQLRAELESAKADLDTARADLEAQAADLEFAKADAGTLRAEADFAKADAFAARADLAQAQAGSGGLAQRAELERLRAAVQQATTDRERLERELETMRAFAEGAPDAELVPQLKQQVEQLVKERDEALRVAMQKPLVVDDNARLEELAAAAHALEPLVWGLKKAAAFFTVQGNDGDAEHLQSLQLVQRGIERLVDDIARAASGQPSAPASSRELEPAEIDGLDFDLL